MRPTQFLNRLSPRILAGTILMALVSLSPQMACSQTESATNSTAKLRLQPSPVASRIGSAVHWQTDLPSALAESEKTGKPVFWYVPTVPKTFMDRKTEIDRYMMAGPFSWPAVINHLNQHFIPLKVVPDAEQAARWELLPYKFVEPGFLVLDTKGGVRQRVDQLTTLHPAWLLHLISDPTPDQMDGQSDVMPPQPMSTVISQAEPGTALHQAWLDFSLDPQKAVDLSADQLDSPQQKQELQLLKGMQLYYQGQVAEAQQIWRDAIFLAPEEPLAWKLAAEREGFGPFVRGFEVHDSLPTDAWQAGRESRGSAAPEGTYSEVELWKRSVDFLLNMQRQDGAIVDSDYDFGGTDSLPNVHVAVTSLAGCALLQALQQPEIAGTDRANRIHESLKRIATFVLNDKNLNPIDRDEILWAYAYRLKFLCLWIQLGPKVSDVPADAGQLAHCVQCLENVQSQRGSWYHEYANSFVTATALLTLKKAADLGAEVSQGKVTSGLDALQRDRFSNGAFPYYSARNDRNPSREGDVAAAAGRMPVCERALLLWERSTDDRLVEAIGQAFQHYEKLRVAYKYDNHTSTLAYGGFFFWYDLQNLAEAIAGLPSGQQKDDFSNRLKQEILRLPELDGRFVDSHELGRAYGTSMALISLGHLPKLKPDAPRDSGH